MQSLTFRGHDESAAETEKWPASFRVAPQGEPCDPAGVRLLRSSQSVPSVFIAALLLILSAQGVQARKGPCARGNKHETHTVKRGETLSAIASAHDLSVTDMLKDNPDLSPDFVREGQELELCIPRRKPVRRQRCAGGNYLHEHKVASGDNLASIQSRYGVSEQDLLRRNPELRKDKDSLRAGENVTVCTSIARINGSRACGYRTPLHRHEVVPGEWLAEIANRYGVRQKDIIRLNASLRRNPDYLRPGQRLRVCPEIAPRSRERLRHTVQKGETMVSIAQSYDLHPQQLIRFQDGRLDNPDALRIGQTLIVWRDGGIVPGFVDQDENDGALDGGVQLPPGQHYVMKSRNLAWGKATTIQRIQSAVAKYAQRCRGRGPTVRIGDISRKGGGRFPPHKSHRTGEDVDVGYALKGAAAEGHRFKTATKSNFDAAHTWQLVKSFLDTGQVRYIFMDYRIQGWLYDYAKSQRVRQSMLDELFQYPRGKRRTRGIIRNDPGHDDHFHVRFW